MSEECCCEYCGAQHASLVVYEFDQEVYETYLCEECDRKEIGELEELEELEEPIPHTT